MNNQLCKKAITVSFENKKLIFIFIAIQMLLNIIFFFPFLFPGNSSEPNFASLISKLMGVSIAGFFINPFIDAGLFGLVFLKLNNKKIGIGDFFHLSKCNFWGFFKVGIFLGLIDILFRGFVHSVLPYILSDPQLGLNIAMYSSNIFSWILYLFFVLAYPLVIIGFFSNQKLKPIRSSAAKFFNKLGMFKFVIVLTFAQAIIGPLSELITPESFRVYRVIFLPILTKPLSFLVLIYSFLLITDFFMKDIQLDLEK